MNDRYLDKLKADMADPAEAKGTLSCTLCGYAFLVRVWPARGDAALVAFLDGLAELAQRTGMTVYGLWMLDPGVARPATRDAMPCQLWRANDRELLATTTFKDAVVMTNDHQCLISSN